MLKRYRFQIQGSVQGVGFRPFIYKTANRLSLSGFIKNDFQGVEIEIEGDKEHADIFEAVLRGKELPPLAKIEHIQKDKLKPMFDNGFVILQSEANSANDSKSATVLPDMAICKDCEGDIGSKDSKYYDYFATTCTNCGPRYSIINTVPYDRKNTSMDVFKMCESCLSEYTDPTDRRYHAQPISCPNCGPKLSVDIKEATQRIKKGQIVAIKGIGSFHLVCDSNNDDVVKRLRVYKNRPAKPFAIMCRDIKQIKTFARINDEDQNLLESKEKPIVILRKKQNITSVLSESIAPNIDRIGCFLPYTALHHILFQHFENPIVATSANLGAEPIISDSDTIKEKLPFVNFVLDFNRDIINAVDDSVVQVVDSKIQTLRSARGYAPKVIKLPFKSKKKILAVGANSKNSIAIVIDDNIILSPHIGDLESVESFEFFKRTIQSFKNFYDFEPDTIVHDKHPSYMTTIWAKEQNKELIEVQHHLVHIYACKAEYVLSGDYLGFSFDGTGYGDDKTLWGGEIFLGDKRKYSFKPIKLLGGEKAIKEPRRVALSMLFDNYSLDEILSFDMKMLKSFSKDELHILHQSYIKDINAPKTSSVGRMFDAMASFADLLQFQSYEGEAGLLCEQVYNPNITKSFDYKIIDGIIDIDFDFFEKEIISMFINTLVGIVLDISKKEKIDAILSGGVFQNKTLLELITSRFEDEGIKYYHQRETAINDGGIALGQIYYALE